jgi:AraC-like DNA-binding protein
MPTQPGLPDERPNEESRWWVATPARIGLLRARYVRQAFPRHAHETFVVCVNEHGGHVSWYRGGSVTIGAGCIAVIPPGEVHSGQPINGQAWHYRAMYPTADLLCALAREAELRLTGLPAFPGLAMDNPSLADAFVRAHRLCEEESDSLAADEGLLDVLTMLLRMHVGGARSWRSPGIPRRAIQCAIDCIQESFAEPLTLEMLVSLTGLPRGTMLRAFRREVGLPPYGLLIQVRIERAKQLLQAGVPIAAVAQQVGFADQSHLTRHFRRLVGVTPGVFARGVARLS